MATRLVPDPVFLTTTQIAHYDDEPSATGFFLNFQSKTYLITNAHAIVNEFSVKGDIELYRRISENPPTLSYWLRDNDDASRAIRERIDLSEDSTRWAFYPGMADISVIELPGSLPSIEEAYEDPPIASSLAISEEQLLGQRRIISESAFVLGYPGDVFDIQHRLPVRRNALIASAFGVPFEGEEMFLTDARMDPGTSGSPVFIPANQVREPSGEHPRNRHGIPYLIGVHSGNYPLNQSGESSGSQRELSDLNETWYDFCIPGAIRWLEQMQPDSEHE